LLEKIRKIESQHLHRQTDYQAEVIGHVREWALGVRNWHGNSIPLDARYPSQALRVNVLLELFVQAGNEGR
jgi:hypothetical protein